MSEISKDLPPKFVIYKLAGASKDGALEYLRKLQEAQAWMKKNMPNINPNLDVVISSINYDPDFDFTDVSLGRSFSVLVSNENNIPIRLYPMIFSSPDNDGEFYILSPVDQDGRTYFAPPDATPITGAEEERLISAIFSIDPATGLSKEHLYRVFAITPVHDYSSKRITPPSGPDGPEVH